MEPPVNFDNLRNITGGDASVEATLFGFFFESAEECMQKLHEALAANDESAWRQNAHAFKGICLNLGALPLGALCSQAQGDFRATAEEKQAMILAIESEFLRVRDAVPQKA